MPSWIRCAVIGLVVGLLLIFGHALFAVGAFAAPLPLPTGCVDSTEHLGVLQEIPPHPTGLSGERLIVVRKEARKLMLFENGALFKREQGGPACWTVALAMDYPAGHKQREGDRKTPEGWYHTSDKPSSQFYGAIAVHYPNVKDADAGRSRGAITEGEHTAIIEALSRGQKPRQRTALGGEILIHGGGSSSDWTLGCVAMTNPELDVLRALLPPGLKTDVLILP